jgi:antitoxin Phd
MRAYSLTELQQHIGTVVDAAIKNPVQINKRGKPYLVMLSLEKYEALESISDAYWGKKAIKSSAEGYIGAKATQVFLKKMEMRKLNAHTRFKQTNKKIPRKTSPKTL